MAVVTKVYEITAPPVQVWRALVDLEVIEQWGAGPAEIRAEPGLEFSLWGGDIYGRIVQVDAGRRLVEEWYSGGWTEPSFATFTLEPIEGGTLLTLVHTEVPDEEAEEIDAGWDEYYLGPMKRLLEGT